MIERRAEAHRGSQSWYPAIVKLHRPLFAIILPLLSFSIPLFSVEQAKPPAKTAAAKKPTTTKKKSTTASRAKKPVKQQQPDEKRVREIQQALNERGYDVEVNGVWGPKSVEALAKFQEQQKITNQSGRGKLDSMTLIALGLGPKREPPQAPASTAQKALTEGKNP